MIERLFDLVKRPDPPHDAEIGPDSTQQNPRVRRLHRYMKRDPSSLVAATLRTGFLVGLAVILILVLLPAITAQAAGPR